jgi:hypothetical protein
VSSDKPSESRDAAETTDRLSNEAAASNAGDSAVRTVERAETRSRHQYARDQRAGIAEHGGNSASDQASSRGNGKDASHVDNKGSDRSSHDQKAEHTGPDVRTEDRRPDGTGSPVADRRSSRRGTAELRSRHQYAQAMRADVTREKPPHTEGVVAADERAEVSTETGKVSRDNADAWPTEQDRGRLHDIYQDWLKEQSGGREKGVNVVGDKPDRSPGDTSDLPPAGEELVELENNDTSRPERLKRWFDREFDDVDDVVNKTATSVQELLERPPPTGHAEVQVPAGPQIESVPHGTPDAGAIAELGLVMGMLGAHAYGAIHRKVAEVRRR